MRTRTASRSLKKPPPCVLVETERGRAALPLEDALRLYGAAERPRSAAWIWLAIGGLGIAGVALLWGAL